MIYSSELGELVLEIARRTFPIIVKDRTREQVVIPQEVAFEFVAVAMEKNSTIKPETVIGCAFSALPGIYERLSRTDEPMTWASVRAALIQEFQNLRRRERYWNDYFKLFYEIVVTCTASWYTKTLIRKYCRYLQYDGSVSFTDDDFKIFLSNAGIQPDESGVQQFIEYEHNYTLLPASYRNRIVDQVIQHIYDLTRKIVIKADRGGPYELLTVINRVENGLLKFDRNLSFETLSFCYPTGNTSTNPIQRRLDAVLSGFISDLAMESVPTSLCGPQVTAN